MSPDTPCQCPRCSWLGTLHDTHELQTDPVQNICPRCAIETVVQQLGQKGLDGLRQEYELLPKMGYQSQLSREEKAERRAQIERFFEHIDQPIRAYNAAAIAEYNSMDYPGDGRESIGGRILSSIPQYQNVAWQLNPMLCESDDFFYSLYRRNWHQVEVEKLTPEDWEFINELGRKYGPNGVFEPLPHWADMSIDERHAEALFQERCAELTEYVEQLLRNTPEIDLGLKPRDWVAQFVNQKQVRLANDRPSDLFSSQDGMGEVEALLREKLRELLP